MKNKFDLQMFAEVVQGKRIVYLYRLNSEEATVDGTNIAFVTENSRSMSVDSDTTETKDGAIVTPGALEHEHEVTSLLKKGDTMIDTLEEACAERSLMDIWEANLEEPGATTGKFKGKYFQGYITEFEITSNAEDATEITMTFALSGAGVAGDVTVTDNQQAVAAYAFRDTPKTGS